MNNTENDIFVSERLKELRQEKKVMLLCSTSLGVLTLITAWSSNILSAGIGFTTLVAYSQYEQAKDEYKQYVKKL